MLKKRMILLQKRPRISLREFDEHWALCHAGIAVMLPGIREYVQNPVIEESLVSASSSGQCERTVDGIAEIWADDSESKPGAEKVLSALDDDELKFIGRLTGFTVTNHESYDPAAKIWIIGDGSFESAPFSEAVSELVIGPVIQSEPANGRLMKRSHLDSEPIAPTKILTIGTTIESGRGVFEAVVKAGANAALRGQQLRVVLTHSRRIL